MSTGAPRRRNMSAVIHRSWLSSTQRNTGQTDNQKDRIAPSPATNYTTKTQLQASSWHRLGAKITWRRNENWLCVRACHRDLDVGNLIKASGKVFRIFRVHRAFVLWPKACLWSLGLEGCSTAFLFRPLPPSPWRATWSLKCPFSSTQQWFLKPKYWSMRERSLTYQATDKVWSMQGDWTHKTVEMPSLFIS